MRLKRKAGRPERRITRKSKVRPLPQIKEGFVRTHFLGRGLLNNKTVMSEIRRLVRASFKHGVETATDFYETGGKLVLHGITLMGPTGGKWGSSITNLRTLKIYAPHNFSLSIHTHPKLVKNELCAEMFSLGDLRQGGSAFHGLVILPFYPSEAKKLEVGFIFATFPKTFDYRIYENRVFQATRGREEKLTPQMQKNILQNLGAKFSSFKMLCGRRFNDLHFSPQRREKIIRDLL